MEVLFVLRGQVRLMVAGQRCDMIGGDLVIINADAPHNSSSTSADALVCGVHLDALHYERLHLPGFASRHYLCRTFLHGQAFMRKVAPIKALIARHILTRVDGAEESMVRDIVASMLACYIHGSIPSVPVRQAATPLRTGSHERIMRIMNRLAAPEGRERLGAVAEDEGVTLSHLSRLFKSHLGIGFRDFAQNLRLDRAAEQLRGSDVAAADIMERTHFGNPAVFYKKFKARFGCTPAQFRRNPGLPQASSSLSDADQRAARELLLIHLADLGRAATLTLGLDAFRHSRTSLSAPHGLTDWGMLPSPPGSA